MSANRKILPLALGFALLAACAVSAIWLSARQTEAMRWVRHTLLVQNGIDRMRVLMASAEAGQRGYLLTGRVAHRLAYEAAVNALPGALAHVDALTEDNAAQQAAIETLRPVIRAKTGDLSLAIALFDMGRPAEARAIVEGERDRALLTTIRRQTDAMFGREKALLASRTAEAAGATRLARTILLGSVLVVILSAAVLVPEGLRRIRDLEQANRRLETEMEERSAAEGQVRQLQKMEAVGQLTGGIAHDFNNMLAIIIGNLDIARRRIGAGADPRLVGAIENAAGGATSAATLTQRLLAFSRRQPLEPRVVNANRLVSSMSELLRRSIGEKVSVETVLAGGLWTVNADPAQIENALLNLAVNARDAMADGGKLTIETANAELDDRYARDHDEVTAGQYVLLSVTDTGSGMDKAVIAQAFEPFFTTKGVGRGTGLGLSQVFGFAKQSGGHLKIYSEAGLGTTVKLYLPRHVGPDEAVAPVAAAGTAGAMPTGRPGEKILVVEDEGQVRQMAVDALRDLGYDVVHAAGGEEALETLARDGNIAMVLTDVIMPGMTGKQLADRVRLDYPAMRLLFTTGYTRNSIVHNGIVAHGVNLLPKPFTMGALAQKVREVMDAPE